MGSTESNKMEFDFASTAHDDVLLPVSSTSSSFIRDVSYSCGSCGYELNLNSCNRNISAMDSKYGKSMKRGVISFFSIDESRFTQINKLQLLPYFTSKSSWRLFRRRTKLLCRNCGNYIGTVSPFQLVKSNPETWDGISACRTYDIKICSLRPLSSEESSIFI
ncbi:unnamed protein product [Fraxinus pennsylvanica]|uniref:Uncharacterized protein n=1 Tax=Fraxinus pennsylvanica TaxID=56036 RepID=A0AAD1ZXS7_9LAMI|nr:unnamed protein product [Fraxinus pennsylvanica]